MSNFKICITFLAVPDSAKINIYTHIIINMPKCTEKDEKSLYEKRQNIYTFPFQTESLGKERRI